MWSTVCCCIYMHIYAHVLRVLLVHAIHQVLWWMAHTNSTLRHLPHVSNYSRPARSFPLNTWSFVLSIANLRTHCLSSLWSLTLPTILNQVPLRTTTSPPCTGSHSTRNLGCTDSCLAQGCLNTLSMTLPSLGVTVRWSDRTVLPVHLVYCCSSSLTSWRLWNEKTMVFHSMTYCIAGVKILWPVCISSRIYKMGRWLTSWWFRCQCLQWNVIWSRWWSVMVTEPFAWLRLGEIRGGLAT